ncbi:hypothetical protein D3C78_1447680 [compost metagenome]
MIRAEHAIDGRCLDYRTACPLLNHVFPYCLRDDEHGVDIHGHNLAPLLQGVAFERSKKTVQIG